MKMTKREAVDLIFSDGQPVFRHIEEARQHITNCLDWQQERLEAANILQDVGYKTIKDDGCELTGKQIFKEEKYTLDTINKLLEIIGKYYKKIGID